MIRRLLSLRRRREEVRKCDLELHEVSASLERNPKHAACRLLTNQLRCELQAAYRLRGRIIGARRLNASGTYIDCASIISESQRARAVLDKVVVRNNDVSQELTILRTEADEFRHSGVAYPPLQNTLSILHQSVRFSLHRVVQSTTEKEISEAFRVAHQQLARMERDLETARQAATEYEQALAIEPQLSRIASSGSDLMQNDVQELLLTLDRAKQDYAVGQYNRALPELRAIKTLYSRFLASSDSQRRSASEVLRMWLNDGKLYPDLDAKYRADIMRLLERVDAPSFLTEYDRLSDRMDHDILSTAIQMGDLEAAYISAKHRTRSLIMRWAPSLEIDELARFARASVRHCRRGERIRSQEFPVNG